MKRALLSLLILLWLGSAGARPLFVDGFDPAVIRPLFPQVGGIYQLPSGPAADQLQWVIGELAAGETTTLDEINAHFDPSALVSVTPAQWQAFFQSLRTTYPNARITDLIGLTPVRGTLVIDSPGSPPPSGFMTIATRYTGARRLTQLGVSTYGGSVQYPEDRVLNLAQAADKFTTLSTTPALLVGRINRNTGQCSETIGRNADSPRATASIFKTWVLGGVGQAIVAGAVAASDPVPLVASELAQGGAINVEPLGTPFPVRDLATLMMGISDNTATDLLHELVGRELIGQVVDAFGVAQPDLLKPMLGISEQFHLFRSFPLAESLTYVNGTQAFKNQFLQERIVPLGPNNGGAFNNTTLYTDGSWRASPFDICRAFGQLRRLPQGSEAMLLVDAAFGAAAAQPDVRSRWDRVWYKGGSLASGANGLHVLTHAWMLENAGEDPHVVIAMSNSIGGGIDQFFVQSITGRLLELVALMP